MPDPVVIRASALSWYADCPRRSATALFWPLLRSAGFELRQLPNGIGAAIGSSIHRAAEIVLRAKAKTGDLPPPGIGADVATDFFKERAREGVQWDRETPEIGAGLTQIVRMVGAYCRDIAPAVQPIIVEEKLEAQVTERIILSGSPDVVAREPGRVRDLKSGKARANCRPQLGAYSLLSRTNGLEIEEVAEDFVQRVGVKHPQPGARAFLHDVGAAETAAVNILRHIESDLATFTEGDPERRILPGDPWSFTANPNSKLCGDKYCRAHGTEFCREWMEKR